mgnify:CR=1 FL=1
MIRSYSKSLVHVQSPVSWAWTDSKVSRNSIPEDVGSTEASQGTANKSHYGDGWGTTISNGILDPKLRLPDLVLPPPTKRRPSFRLTS